MDLPRQRKQTARYTYNDGEGDGLSELDSSDDTDSDTGGKKGGKIKGNKFIPCYAIVLKNIKILFIFFCMHC